MGGELVFSAVGSVEHPPCELSSLEVVGPSLPETRAYLRILGPSDSVDLLQ